MMTNILRNSALALALLGGVALVSTPVLAKSYKQGHYGNSWNNYAQNDSYRRHNRSAFRAYDGNAYRYPYYGPGYRYGSNYNYGRPGLSITIR